MAIRAPDGANNAKTLIVKIMLRANSYWIQKLRDQNADKVVSHFAQGVRSHQLLKYIHIAYLLFMET